MKINLHVLFYFIVSLKILYITWETGHMESSILLSLSASCYVCDEEKQFHYVFPIKNKKNSLLTLIFKQITPNLEESICTPWNTCPPNLRLINVIVF